MSDPGDRLRRYRVVEWLVVLASTYDEQAAYIRPSQEAALPDIWPFMVLDDWLNEGVDWTAISDERGALSPEIVSATAALTEAVESIIQESDDTYDKTGVSLLTPQAVRDDSRWEQIRLLARTALKAYRDLGIPTPKLSDTDFNTPRDDAP